jgi:hypothetical protein
MELQGFETKKTDSESSSSDISDRFIVKAYESLKGN